MSSDRQGLLLRNTEGVVYAEFLIAWIPLLVLAISAWQTIDLCAADLLVRRAASVAARAAAVVLPDDPAFFAGEHVGEFAGRRRAEIELAAALVLAISPRFRSMPHVNVTIEPSGRVLTASVTASIDCFMGAMNPVCGGSKRELRAQSSFPYQGARYLY